MSEPMESCAPCPIADRDPCNVAAPAEDFHMVTRGPSPPVEDGHMATHRAALPCSLSGPGCQQVATSFRYVPGRVHSAVSESLESGTPGPTHDRGPGGREIGR